MSYCPTVRPAISFFTVFPATLPDTCDDKLVESANIDALRELIFIFGLPHAKVVDCIHGDNLPSSRYRIGGVAVFVPDSLEQ